MSKIEIAKWQIMNKKEQIKDFKSTKQEDSPFNLEIVTERLQVELEALNLYVKLKYKIENYKTEQADLIKRLKLKEYDTEAEKEYMQNRLCVVNAILKDLL